VFERLLEELRRSQAATDRYDQAVADATGLNRTDMRFIDVLDREGPVPAGRFAQALGLTTGAVTTALDRLERGGWARRVRDEGDRRRVLVELTDRARGLGGRFYAEHAAYAERLYERHTEDDLRLVLEFLVAGSDLNERLAEALEARTREEKEAR
jgi:DNA-binding MarR family transcriptional regulator